MDRPPAPCPTGRVITGLDRRRRHALQAALAQPAVSTRAIHRATTSEGLRLSRAAIGLHRDGRCACCGGGAA